MAELSDSTVSPNNTHQSLRLNKYLAEATGISRRQADDAIAAGQVTVNDSRPVLGARITPHQDRVSYRGNLVEPKTSYHYLLLNKPTGYVCSRKQQDDKPTIFSLLPSQYRILKPVGRLDADSSGLLLLSDDGDFAHTMTHPSFRKTKIYTATLDQPLSPLHQQMISDIGVTLDDGVSQLHLSRQTDGDDHAWIVTMHEGRNRQIRRTFGALGYTVTALDRTQFGPYRLDGLAIGEWRIGTRL